MSNILSSTYEIINKLGSGGGGVIYLANHLRLNKQVVIKIDKRSIKTNPELLRREVDILKNLNHSFIPQVYDFFIEDGSICTVMDYIPGESLDKPLKRGEKFSQPLVIEWACQLLEALNYLHNVKHGDGCIGYVHGDIKPSNIMRKPDNSICLIDFNIALALGETSVLGCSPGYASPEHYGESFSANGVQSELSQDIKSEKHDVIGKSGSEYEYSNTIETTIRLKSDSIKNDDFESSDKTEKLSGNEITELLYSADMTESLNDSQTTINLADDRSWLPLRKDAGSNTALIGETQEKAIHKKNCGYVTDFNNTGTEDDKVVPPQGSSKTTKAVIPVVQSDIYSLGATLYHLLSGERPAKDARDVIPLSDDVVSPQISEIIAKAMNPDVNLRYQSAQEMLTAFKNIRDTDTRMIKFKRTRKVILSGLSVLLTIGILLSFVGLIRLKTTEKWLKLAELSQNSLREGDVNKALDLAISAFPDNNGLLTPEYASSAQRALSNALGVYDLSDGFKHYGIVELDSAPFDIVMSPTGATATCIFENSVSVIDLHETKVLFTMPAGNSALSEVCYLDENTIVYSGDKGLTAYDLSERKALWHGEKSTAISTSANGEYIAAVYKDESFARIYNAMNGKLVQTVDFDGKKQSVVVNDVFANPNDSLFELNNDGSLLAVSFSDGSLMIYDLLSDNDDDDLELFDSTSGFSHFEGGFYSQYFALSATNKSNSIFSIVDTKKKVSTGGFDYGNYYGVQTDEDGIYVSTGNVFVKIDPESGHQTPLINAEENIEHYSRSSEFTVVSSGKNIMFFNSKAGKISEVQNKNQIDFVGVSGDYAVFAGHDSHAVYIMKYEEYKQNDEILYDPSCLHDEARISADGKTLMLFNYKELTVTDLKGNIINNVKIPNPDQVYDQQFRRKDGKSYLEVIYNDGTFYCYDAADGNLFDSGKGKQTDSSLDEVFYTDKYQIDAPLHGAPKVYDKKSGKFVTELQSDSYLTYVTQVGEYLVLQYRDTDGYYYGRILNEKCEIIADLPYLCDTYNGEVFFDYPSGNVRKSHIYSIDELIKLAQK